MLVLQRKIGEAIVIGKEISVVITRIQGDRVTLGFQAPREVPIRREELELDLSVSGERPEKASVH